MPTPSELLEQQAELLFNNVAGWESRTLERIAKRIKKTGKMNLADIKSLNNMAVTCQEMDDIIKDLAQVTGQNIAEVQKIYSDSIDLQHKNNKYLYDYRDKPFVPLSDNKQLQALVKAYSRTTAETMINLSKTKALGFVDSTGKFTNMQDSIYDALGKATMQVATGSSDFHTAMRGVIEQLGGSGVRVHYGSGVNRRLDTVVRQNLLWGGKQASIEYNDIIGDELGCDGIEVDYHSNPRPSHRFMQGEMFSLHGKKTINGITYEDATEALERLDDYGCLHFKTPVILGVSEPRYTQSQLNEMREKDLKMLKVGDDEKTGYEWTQAMRRLETEARKEKDIINGLKAAGDEEGARQHRKKLRAINQKYDDICTKTGLTPQKERMRVYGGTNTTKNTAKTLENMDDSGIINLEDTIPNNLQSTADYFSTWDQSKLKDFAQNLLDNFGIKQTVQMKRMAGANGSCGWIVDGHNKINMVSYKLNSADRRSMPHRVKTALHESYHYKSDGLVTDRPAHKMLSGFSPEEWRKWEETFTECSAHYMGECIGNPDVAPSYANYLVETLPKLKHCVPEFANCSTIKDFGKIAYKFRFGTSTQVTAKWENVHYQTRMFRRNVTDYSRQYMDYIKRNKSQLIDFVNGQLATWNRKDIEGLINSAIDKIDNSQVGDVINFDSRNEKVVFEHILINAMNAIGVK